MVLTWAKRWGSQCMRGCVGQPDDVVPPASAATSRAFNTQSNHALAAPIGQANVFVLTASQP